jgi:hypothetical protein
MLGVANIDVKLNFYIYVGVGQNEGLTAMYSVIRRSAGTPELGRPALDLRFGNLA